MKILKEGKAVAQVNEKLNLVSCTDQFLRKLWTGWQTEGFDVKLGGHKGKDHWIGSKKVLLSKRILGMAIIELENYGYTVSEQPWSK